MTSSSQNLLFDIHPLGTEPPVEQRVITPGCLLPAPDNKFVDAARIRAILGVDDRIIQRLLSGGQLRGYRFREMAPWNIEYASVVEFCDALRIEYHIADRRTRPRGDGRWRDAELLPFPLADTVSTNEAMVGLNQSRVGVLRLCEEGRFECYRLLPIAKMPWRISKASLFDFRDRLIAQMSGKVRK